jgi:glycosyltransferase involved in cell wall biosynthesis
LLSASTSHAIMRPTSDAKTTRRPKILIVAYACNPYRSSEHAIGWSYVAHLAPECRLTVVTRAKHRDDIISFVDGCGRQDIRNIEWIYYDLPLPLLGLKRRLLGVQLYFILWQAFVFQRLRRWIERQDFDVVNHLTFGTVWSASPFHRSAAPFVWGPIGGGDTIPWSFLREESLASICREATYKVVVWYARRLSPSNRKCRNRSAAIVFRNDRVRQRYSDLPDAVMVRTVCETGISPTSQGVTNMDYAELHAIAASRLNYWKGVIYAVKGFEAFLQTGGIGTLTVIGDGTEFRRIRDYVDRRQLSKWVVLLGSLGQSELRRQMRRSNVLIFPSFRDGGSFIVLDAMALGLPTIVNDLSGPYQTLGDEAGIVVRARTPQRMTEEIAMNLHRLQRDSSLGRRKSALLKQRAHECFTWEKNASDLFGVYMDVLERRTVRPAGAAH